MNRPWWQSLVLFAGSLGLVVWVAASLARLLLAYDLFIPGTLEFKPGVTDELRLYALAWYARFTSFVLWGFASTLTAGIVLTIVQRKFFRLQGWRMMITIIFWFTAAVQAYMLNADIRMMSFFDLAAGVPLAGKDEIIQVFLLRFQNVVFGLAMWTVVMSAVTMLALTIFQPLTQGSGKSLNIKSADEG